MKAKLLDVNAIKTGMANVKNAVAFGGKLAEANKKAAERLTNRQQSITRLVNDIEMYGLSEARFKAGKELYEAELKGRTLASIIQSHSMRMARAVDNCIDDEETTNVVAKFELIAKLQFEDLKALEAIFEEQAEKVEDVKAKKVAKA